MQESNLEHHVINLSKQNPVTRKRVFNINLSNKC